MTMTRYDFLRGAVASAAMMGVPARVWGAAKMLDKPDLLIGVLSDIHIQLPPAGSAVTVDRFRHALEYFRDRGVDGVLVAGDLANAGLETELAAVAKTWFEVFPGGRLPNGKKVANLMHYGDHDTEARFYKPALKEKFTKQGLAVPRSMSEGENRREIWEKYFHEPWSPIRHVKVKGYDFVLSNFMREGSASAPKDLEAQLRAMKLDPNKPFFYSQHRWIRNTYLADEEMAVVGRDNGVTHTVLPKYPNCIAFQGHTHYMITDDRSLWIGDYISINAGSLLTQCVGRQRENGVDIPWHKNDYMCENQMACVPSGTGHAGMVMSLKGDLMTLERRDFGLDLSLGPDLVFSVDPKARDRYADGSRKAASIAPEFPRGAAVSVASRAGQDRRHRAVDQVVVAFPTVKAAAMRPRAHDYEVTAEAVDGTVVCRKRVYSPTINLPEEKEAPEASCVFAAREVGGAVRFSVRPGNCWGKLGAPISVEWKSRG